VAPGGVAATGAVPVGCNGRQVRAECADWVSGGHMSAETFSSTDRIEQMARRWRPCLLRNGSASSRPTAKIQRRDSSADSAPGSGTASPWRCSGSWSVTLGGGAGGSSRMPVPCKPLCRWSR